MSGYYIRDSKGKDVAVVRWDHEQEKYVPGDFRDAERELRTNQERGAKIVFKGDK